MDGMRRGRSADKCSTSLSFALKGGRGEPSPGSDASNTANATHVAEAGGSIWSDPRVLRGAVAVRGGCFELSFPAATLDFSPVV